MECHRLISIGANAHDFAGEVHGLTPTVTVLRGIPVVDIRGDHSTRDRVLNSDIHLPLPLDRELQGITGDYRE
jgi:hypothetical protein